ncbi:DegT/DnrJ/EryC1/StrS family aminotransferase [Pectinatus sottacetonis]|uniref:DegT/DnrJ/EryC1/StrS family aminotransferase n=1 Tax=Pectinatus sottacetonis TaxID=1002795 RepID=UPI0018C67310|nr:DegT/DnrJ/EryC1/StrS family aminotransferase [Pectinatus sottacetonis]
MRTDFLPFSKPTISEDAIADVCDSIRSGWLAMGPKTVDFEKKFAEYTGAKFAISVNSATAGLHLAVMAVTQPGDEVITTPMTFASTVNAIIYAGAVPILADIDPVTLNIDPKKIAEKITSKTKAVIPVHFAGRPCNMDAIEKIAQEHNLAIIEDSAHALGASYHGKKIGSGKGPRRIAVFSFHPTKNITTGEGGMITTDDEKAADQMSVQRQNGMDKGAWNRFGAKGKSHYDIFIPGLKYQMMDIQAAIGRDQLKYLEKFNKRRTEIIEKYNTAFAGIDGLTLPAPIEKGCVHSWHIYTPLLDSKKLGFTRDEFMEKMKEYNIGTAYHYQALHLFSGYAKITGLKKGDMPVAEEIGEKIVSLPLFPAMTNEDITDVIEAVTNICK